MCLNPFGTGQCLSTTSTKQTFSSTLCLNPFGTGQCLSTEIEIEGKPTFVSQSLWNRAMSFDLNNLAINKKLFVSIPLEQGNVFRRRINHQSIIEQGLNPFGTGQCLSTDAQVQNNLK